jgi:ectoine hydroxylase-related dioxygenase (phytanoyl-CoA dioxygenase family)
MSLSHTREVDAMDTRIVTDITPWFEQLMSEGYCIIRGIIPEDFVDAAADDLAPHFAATPHSVGAFYGHTTRRFHGLLTRSRRIERFVVDPVILGIVETVLGTYCDRVQLNLTQAIEIEPGGDAQPPHRDQDMWPQHVEGTEYLVNVMWPFTPYRADNGGTIIWPGSHRRQSQIVLPEEEAIVPELDPGDVLLFLGSTLHAGGANRAGHVRRGMIISYSLGWLKPYELPWLTYPPEVARTFSDELAALAGYRAHRPNLGTYEGRCPSHLLRDDGGKDIGAIDALRPEQERLIEAYRRGELDPAPFVRTAGEESIQ